MRRKWIAAVSLCVLLLSGAVFSAEPEKAKFSGTVTGDDGAAIEGASVSLYMMTIDRESMSYKVLPKAEVKSDDQGKFSFETDSKGANGYVVYCCLAQKEGLASAWASLTSGNEATWQITMGQPETMSGVVKDTDGNAIADAEVRLVFLTIPGGQEQFMFGIEPIDAFATKTSSDGKFEFNNLPKDATAEFLVKKDGKGAFHTLDASMNPEAGFTYKAGQTDVVLTMEAGCKVSGTVVSGDDQKPVGDISLMVLDTSMPINLVHQPIKSAADGTFEFDDLSSGDYKVGILDDDWIAEPVTVSVANGTDAEATIKLTKGGTLEVKVVDSETKEPIEGVSVNFRDEQTQQNQNFVTDENGVGNKQVLPGTYTVRAYKQGYRSSNDAGSVVVEDGKTANLKLGLAGKPKLTGLVTDSDGKPVEGAVIRVVPGGGGQRDGIKTDEKGQFTMAWDSAQASWAEGEFYLTATHVEKNLAGIVQFADSGKKLSVKLEKAGSAKGKVVGQDGKVIAGASARLYFHGSRFSTSFGEEIKTDDNGEYELKALAYDQRYSVHITKAKGYGVGQENVQLILGQTEIVVKEIILQIADQKVTGQVVDVDGKGLADVQLHCYGTGQPNINTKTDKEGNFVLENICVGEIRISASYRNGQEHQSGNVRTEGGAEDVMVIVASRGSSQRFVPKKAASLVGKPLPDMKPYGVDVPQDTGMILLFAWDMNQRPSRHFIKKLNAKADLLKEKGVTVVLINTSPIEKEKLQAWLKDNSIAYPCGVISENAKDVKFKMGIAALPWLILTDAEHKVVSEGFSVKELEGKLESR